MKKELMHKNTVVAEISENNIQISSVTVLNEDLFPKTGDTNPINNYRRWKIMRQTNPCRKDIQPFAGFYGPENFQTDSLRSLNDCYWIRKKGDKTTFEQISAFRISDLSEDGIFLSLVRPNDFDEFTEDSPNLCIPGNKPLFWYQDENQLGLINRNAQSDMFLYKTARDNGLDIVTPRKYLIIYNIIYTFTPICTSENIERIPFEQLYNSVKDPELSNGANIQKCCEYYNIKNWKTFISKMVQLNKLIQINLSELYVLRDTNTLEFIGFDNL